MGLQSDEILKAVDNFSQIVGMLITDLRKDSDGGSKLTKEELKEIKKKVISAIASLGLDFVD